MQAYVPTTFAESACISLDLYRAIRYMQKILGRNINKMIKSENKNKDL